MLGPGGVYEFSPVGTPVPNFGVDAGQLRQMIPAPGATTECFDPSGRYLVVPGAGLFNNFGKPLPSTWATVTNGARCVVDGLGHVYVSSGSGPVSNTGPWTVTEYDEDGSFLQAVNISVSGLGPLAIDLAPDECTMYYSGWDVNVGIGRFNVCTGTPESPQPGYGAPALVDDLRVLPNWQVIHIGDGSAGLLDDAGTVIRSWGPSTFLGDSLRTVSLNPDDMSFWAGGNVVSQVDFNSGQLLEQWASTVGTAASPTFANYSAYISVDPAPLLGNADVQAAVDSNSAGTAEAFPTLVRYSGQISALHLYVDSASTASQVVVGIYSDRNGGPGTLQDQATITNLRAGSWNYVDVPSTDLTEGHLYWIAVLAPRGGGTIMFRDRRLAGLASVSAQHMLSALPAHWSGGRWTLSGSLSAYGS